MNVSEGAGSSPAAPSQPRRLMPKASVVVATAIVVFAGLGFNLASPAGSTVAGCMIYVGAGDDVTNGHDLSDDSKRYPEQLVNDHIKTPGWCLYNQGKNGQTSSA